jgi:subtilase family serine protease
MRVLPVPEPTKWCVWGNMMSSCRRTIFGALAFLCCLLSCVTAQPTAAAPPSSNISPSPAIQITQAINPAQMTPMQTNVRPEATAANDLGAVADDFPMDHMLLLLHRPDAQEQALEQLMSEQLDQNSPNFHNWLTAEQFGQYGLVAEDLDAINGWLQAQGFTVNEVFSNGVVVDFSGTAGQIRQSFQTEIHNLNVNGTAHIANMSVPEIPSALSPAVVGIVSMNDFRPHTNFKPRPEYTYTNANGTFYALVPADLAKIYNFGPLFTASPTAINGAGQTIALVEDTNVFSTADITTFRSTFGLVAATFTQAHPENCTNPDVLVGNDGEAELDVEWAGAAAPGAALELVSCADTSASFGGLIAMQKLLNAGSPPPIWSVSYSNCEAENGATANAAYVTTYQQAASAGVSVFVASGDQGAANCDAGDNVTAATHGVGVNAFASTPYNVAVGGTDFGDGYANTYSTYWNSNNAAAFGSAKSYINEIPWNDSCAGVLVSTIAGFSVSYGSSGFCNSSLGEEFLTIAAGSGGPSACATGSPSIGGVVGGSCRGTAKPSWQSGILGNPVDGVRDIPDVSLFASNGFWGHYYVYCYTNAAGGGASCGGAPSTWVGAGGTSFASPIMAGIQALVNQKTHSHQGNPNPTYYALAAAEYGASGSTSCNSSKGNLVGSSCIFYDVTQGDMDVNCTGTHNCYRPSGTNGVLSLSNSAYQPAYGTTTGWDFATGIGSVNAANLVNNWPGSGGTKLVFSVEPNGTYASGAAITVKVSVENSAGTVITTDTSAIALTLSGGTPGATLGGTTTVNAIAGVATFSNLTVNKAGTSYTLSATDGSLTGASSSTFNISAGTAKQLSFTTQPPTTLQSGAPFGVTVTVQDAAGNTVTGSSATVALALSGTNGGASLSGTATRSASSGVATFTGLSVDLIGSYTLQASSSGLTNGTSGSFSITPGTAAKLAFTTSPPTSAQSGAPFGAAVTVEDAAGNPITGSNATVALTLSGGTTGATLSGVTATNASSGVATFTGLSVNKVGTAYVLNATSSGLTGIASGTFNITPGTAAKLVFTTQPPTSTQSNKSFAAAVSVEDAAGNIVTSNTSTVTLSLINNITGATLTGGSAAAASGVATFSLSVNNAGIGYQLRAADGSLTVATSNAFNVTSGIPATITFSVQPSNAVAGVAIAPAIVVQVLDISSVPVVGDTVTLTIATNPGGSAITSGGPVATDASGNATFNNVSLNRVGAAYTLTAADGVVQSAASNPFDISIGPAAQLVFTTQPVNLLVGGILNMIAVTEEDAAGNVIADNSSSADFTIAACGGSVDLGSVILSNGVGTLSGSQRFYTAAVGLQIDATTGAVSGTSANFNVSANAGFIFANGFDTCRL